MQDSKASNVNGAKTELVSGNRLRVGLNMGNFLLVRAGESGKAPTGIVPDLAQMIATRLGAQIDWVPYPDAGVLSNGSKGDRPHDAWDIAFMGAEPARAATIDFTDAYVEIEATYLVRGDSPMQSPADVDRLGVRVASSARAAYTLYLERTLKRAELVCAEGLEGSFQLFVDRELDVLAGLAPRLLQDQPRLAGARLLPGRFTAVQQAMATPTGRPAAFAFLKAFVAEIRRDATVAQLVDKHGVRGLNPLGPAT